MSERQVGPLPVAQVPPVVDGPQAPYEFTTIPFTADGLNQVARSVQVAGEMQDKRFKEFENRILAIEQGRR